MSGGSGTSEPVVEVAGKVFPIHEGDIPEGWLADVLSRRDRPDLALPSNVRVASDSAAALYVVLPNRDPDLFGQVLRLLRGERELPDDREELQRLYREANFYGLAALAAELSASELKRKIDGSTPAGGISTGFKRASVGTSLDTDFKNTTVATSAETSVDPAEAKSVQIPTAAPTLEKEPSASASEPVKMNLEEYVQYLGSKKSRALWSSKLQSKGYSEDPKKNIFTLDEVSKHVSFTDCWIAVHGRVYDITDFLDAHPAGINSIMRHAGRDCTEDLDFHTAAARGLLKYFEIGRLEGSGGCVIS